MGNLCSKSSNPSDPFAQPGRVLGTSPDSGPSSAPVPQKQTISRPAVKGGKTLGGSGSTSDQTVEPRNAAARAAEERAAKQNATANKGKLGSQLAAQKAKTQGRTLNELSQTERATRDVDAAETSRRWD
ncbi:hypothetical protein D8B26_007351 [Coccidioides posadasii str. Silveira]|uniref:Uncharacterized protein n=3 Tax=Coccidioides posadasii TaxID=199306 RepID=E9D3J1_COCPS|nr:hypothetical protein CPC735_013830 [Coccidioides posadasii C735 delta SOWgp]EER30065.1 hypothetical protein CPC735_013830 [Coccidioides posadasii C735 delta SOWgp]EFW19186.1 conserved hypothetical protein [Coccidioides posadasii str. Silveira]KMM71537.1 hypothetical protein CPAG_07844 [Coccidioides posadasii RMSCC 3488]QVM12735.1 hypothetical protein D8B26_007351 [Coccidioides posadasii str. Silveira]|eukprot:XP_003072210.1 hypothetical protein CPC735_013830 [Coccidioides posadasii C735 delta SOWgp]